MDEIGERYAEITNYRLNHTLVVELYDPYTQFRRNVRRCRRRIVTFMVIAPYKYSY